MSIPRPTAAPEQALGCELGQACQVLRSLRLPNAASPSPIPASISVPGSGAVLSNTALSIVYA